MENELVSPDALAREIAGEWQAGMDCFVHRKTREMLTLPEDDDPEEFVAMTGIDIYKDDRRRIYRRKSQFDKLEKPASSRVFAWMEDFINQQTDGRMKERLVTALSQRKPFSRFQYALGYDLAVRQAWFDYQNTVMEEEAAKQLAHIFQGGEEE